MRDDTMSDDCDMVLDEPFERRGEISFLEKELPIDAACLIMSFLYFSELQSMSRCSRRMYYVVSHAHYINMEETFELPRVTYQSDSEATESKPSYLTQRSPLLNHRTLTNILYRYSNLKELHLAGLSAVGDSLFRLINEAPAASNIRSLTIQGASLTYWCPGLLQLPRLENLKVVGGSIRASLALILGPTTSLKSLSFAQCPGLRDDHLRSLVAPLAESLEELNVHQCLRIKHPRIESNRLQKLSFMGCFALIELPNLHAPAVRELNLSFCLHLNSQQIHSIVDSLPSLEILRLVKCPLIDRLYLQSLPNLCCLDVSYCNSLNSLQIRKCHDFTELECNGCLSLQTLVLQGVEVMEYLCLSSLPIQRLVIAAPRLVHLEMKNCKLLADCLIRAPSLQSVNVHGSRTVALRFCKQIRSVLMENHWMARTPLEV
jgi:hypothetical protein